MHLLLPSVVAIAVSSAHAQPIEYPPTRRVDQVDTYHGERIADPYRWLEDDQSDESQAWIKSQDALFRDYVKSSGNYAHILERTNKISYFDSMGAPTKAGDRTFISRTSAERSKPIWYVSRADGSERQLLDTATFFDDPDIRINGYTPSPDGSLLAIGTDRGAGTWGDIRVLDVDTGELIQDRLVGSGGRLGYPGVMWTSDSKAFAYFHADPVAPNGDDSVALRNVKIRLHRVGSNQTADPVVYARPDRPDALINTVTLTTDDRYVISSLTEKSSRHTQHLAIDLQDSSRPPIPLVSTDARLWHVGNHGTFQYYRTDLDAPKGRVIAIDAEQPEPEHWLEILPEADDTLSNVVMSKDYIVARYDRHATPTLRIFDHEGNHVSDAKLPGIGGVGVSTSPRHNQMTYSFGVLFDPGTIYALDPKTGESKLLHRAKLAFNPDDYVMKQEFYTSFDGTRVPMFIAHRKDLELDGTAPLWMYGFGNSGWVAFPWFQAHLVAWLEMGGVYALPGLRGGGEYGSEWRDAGMHRNKPNTIGDYIAAAEYLAESNYTAAGRIVANGGSGSGPLPAIAINQRPELFGAAVVDFPFLDMLRYHISAEGFTRSYGSPEDPEDYAVLRSYSPYHNIPEGECLPPTLVTVAEMDQSTHPLHCYKHVAALQHAQACEHPMMLQVIWNAGHYSYGTDREASNSNLAAQIAFVVRAMGL